MSSKQIAPSRVIPRRTVDSHEARRTAWNDSSSVRTSRTGRPSLSAANTSAGSYLACCLPPNAPPGSGAMTRTLASGSPRTPAIIRCSQYGCWIALQTDDAVAVGRGHVRVRLDGELGDHREVVAALDDEVRAGLPGREVAPVDAVLVEDVGGRERLAGAQRRVLDERRVRRQGAGDREDRGQRLVVDAHGVRAGLRLVDRVGDDQRDGVAVVLGLADGEHGPVLVLGPEAGHGLRQVVGRQHEVDAGHRERGARVDAQRSGPAPQSTVTSFAWSASGTRRSATYWVAPVTRPMPPTRAGESPIRDAVIRMPAPAAAVARGPASKICS